MGTMPQTLPEARAFSAFHTTCLNPESLATVLAKDTKKTKKKNTEQNYWIPETNREKW